MAVDIEKSIVTKSESEGSHFSPRFPLEQKIANKLIELRAWQLWQEAGCPSGRDLQFWTQAEREVLHIGSVMEPLESAAGAIKQLASIDGPPAPPGRR